MLEERNLKLDLFALALLALTVFLSLSLVTYNRADPIRSGSLSTLEYPAPAEATNVCGPWGALVAHTLLNFLGIGAYFLVVSMAVLDVFLLIRRKINDHIFRVTGWLLALVGLTSFAAMALPSLSPGPVIGPGGYVGATGRGLLEMNFASVGAYILSICLILGGLLLCTDYFLIRLAAWTALLSSSFLGRVSRVMLALCGANRTSQKTSKDDLVYEQDEDDEEYEYEEDEYEDSASQYDDEYEEEPVQIRFHTKAASGAESSQDPQDLEAQFAEKNPPPNTLPGRLAAALRFRKSKKTSDREELMQQLDEADLQEDLEPYELPSLDLLLEQEEFCFEQHKKEVRRNARILEKTFANFGFRVKVVEIETGPVIAQYEIALEKGLRLSKITNLSNDLAIALRVPSVRIVAPIPGKNTVGIEVPNVGRQLVRLREVMEEANGRARKMGIPIFLGKDVAGNAIVVDLATLPHLLIAGRTGTGKSVSLNAIILSILMTRRPDEVKLLLIDPKMVELSSYKKLPHLMHPVVTDMRKAEAILAWAVEKMENRYELLARAGVRHVNLFNKLGEEELLHRLKPESEEEQNSIPTHLPYIVIVTDEMADLMMCSGKEVEQHIIRLAQKSRAVGIHLVLATQKPTVDVITGLIKSNLPARICFEVASGTDSRVVLDDIGAEKLLGSGDMLFLRPGTSTLLRGQGTYLSDDEINNVIDFVGTTEPQFVKELVQLPVADSNGAPDRFKDRDELYERAVEIVVREGRGSVSLLQRYLSIGYGRAGKLIDYMAEDGIVGIYNGSQAREVLVTLEQWEEMSGDEPTPEPPPKRNKILHRSDIVDEVLDSSDQDVTDQGITKEEVYEEEAQDEYEVIDSVEEDAKYEEVSEDSEDEENEYEVAEAAEEEADAEEEEYEYEDEEEAQYAEADSDEDEYEVDLEQCDQDEYEEEEGDELEYDHSESA